MSKLVVCCSGALAAAALYQLYKKYTASKPPNKIVLTYFDIKGVAEKVRLALAIGNVPFEDKRIQFSQWPELKPTTPFEQLPVMEAGDQVIAQSNAMLMLAARWGGGTLYPTDDPILCARIDEMLGLFEDMRSTFSVGQRFPMRDFHVKYGHSDKMTDDERKAITKRLRETWVSTSLPTYMQYFVGSIKKSGGPFLCGPLSIADLTLLPWLEFVSSGGVDFVESNCFDGYPEILEYMERVRAVPAIAKYYADRK